jgi:hypothetical protein
MKLMFLKLHGCKEHVKKNALAPLHTTKVTFNTKLGYLKLKEIIWDDAK